jgi:hypothetical protein
MKDYHARIKGKVMMTKILNGANTTFDHLPVIQEFVNKDSNKMSCATTMSWVHAPTEGVGTGTPQRPRCRIALRGT